MQFNIPRVFIICNTFRTNISSCGENNSSRQKNRTSWKSAKAALYTIRAKDKVVLEHNINLPSTNLLDADAQGTVLGNDADLADIQPDNPLQNLQQSTSSTIKVVCHTKGCTTLGDMLCSGYAHDDPRSKQNVCDAWFEKKRLACAGYSQKIYDKKKGGNQKIQKLAHDEVVTVTSHVHP